MWQTDDTLTQTCYEYLFNYSFIAVTAAIVITIAFSTSANKDLTKVFNLEMQVRLGLMRF